MFIYLFYFVSISQIWIKDKSCISLPQRGSWKQLTFCFSLAGAEIIDRNYISELIRLSFTSTLYSRGRDEPQSYAAGRFTLNESSLRGHFLRNNGTHSAGISRIIYKIYINYTEPILWNSIAACVAEYILDTTYPLISLFQKNSGRALNRHKSNQKTGIDWMANLKNSNRLDDDF